MSTQIKGMKETAQYAEEVNNHVKRFDAEIQSRVPEIVNYVSSTNSQLISELTGALIGTLGALANDVIATNNAGVFKSLAEAIGSKSASDGTGQFKAASEAMEQAASSAKALQFDIPKLAEPAGDEDYDVMEGIKLINKLNELAGTVAAYKNAVGSTHNDLSGKITPLASKALESQNESVAVQADKFQKAYEEVVQGINNKFESDIQFMEAMAALHSVDFGGDLSSAQSKATEAAQKSKRVEL